MCQGTPAQKDNYMSYCFHHCSKYQSIYIYICLNNRCNEKFILIVKFLFIPRKCMQLVYNTSSWSFDLYNIITYMKLCRNLDLTCSH